MTVNANWPRDIFGVDLSRAVPNRTQLVGGVAVDVPSLVFLPQNTVETDLTIPTVFPYTVLPSDVFIVINRVAPVTTSLILPSIASRGGLPLLVCDLSTSISDPTGHTITLTPDGSEKIARLSSWDMFSLSVSLTSGWFRPVSSLSNWTAGV